MKTIEKIRKAIDLLLELQDDKSFNNVYLHNDALNIMISHLWDAKKAILEDKKNEKLETYLRKRFEEYTDEELQIFNGENEETLKTWNREDSIKEAIEMTMKEENN